MCRWEKESKHLSYRMNEKNTHTTILEQITKFSKKILIPYHFTACFSPHTDQRTTAIATTAQILWKYSLLLLLYLIILFYSCAFLVYYYYYCCFVAGCGVSFFWTSNVNKWPWYFLGARRHTHTLNSHRKPEDNKWTVKYKSFDIIYYWKNFRSPV